MNKFKTLEEIQAIMERNKQKQQEQAVVVAPIYKRVDEVEEVEEVEEVNRKEYQKVYQEKYNADEDNIERKKKYNRAYYQRTKEVEVEA